MALHSQHISSILFTRIAAIVFIYSGVLSFNAFYIQSIGSGIGIYSGIVMFTCIYFLKKFYYKLVSEGINNNNNFDNYKLQKQNKININIKIIENILKKNNLQFFFNFPINFDYFFINN